MIKHKELATKIRQLLESNGLLKENHSDEALSVLKSFLEEEIPFQLQEHVTTVLVPYYKSGFTNTGARVKELFLNPELAEEEYKRWQELKWVELENSGLDKPLDKPLKF